MGSAEEKTEMSGNLPQISSMFQPQHLGTPNCPSKDEWMGVPVVAQWLTNLTRNHEVVGLIPALAQWVNDPALL